MMEKSGCVLISWDISNGTDKTIVIVGKKAPGKDVDVINAFQGEEAMKVLQSIGSPHISKVNKKEK